MRVSEETLCEPLDRPQDHSATSRQRCDIIDSLCGFNSQIKVLGGRILGRKTLDNPSVSLHNLGRRIRHLSLKIFGYQHYSTVCLVGLRQILETALELETLELHFDDEGKWRPVVLFDHIWPNLVHYSSLKCLSLRGFRVSQLRLQGILSLHALTLSSLELIDIGFEWKEARDKICAGSWADMIQFLEEHLNLTQVEFDGFLANGWDEAWYLMNVQRCIDEPPYQSPTETLKYRIEQYVAKGGICPLDLPRGREDDNKRDYWFEINDLSWQWYPEGCDPSWYDDE